MTISHRYFVVFTKHYLLIKDIKNVTIKKVTDRESNVYTIKV